MVSLSESIILGILQGLTEWFPISSSGHLVLFQTLFHTDVPLAYDIYLHLGTLLVLLIYFWEDIITIIRALLKRQWRSAHGKIGISLIIGSIATASIGLLFYDTFQLFFNNIRYVAYAFLCTGMLLHVTKHLPRGTKPITHIPAFFIGLSQGISLIPGISRSGATIGTGMLLGIKQREAAKFSFLLSIPAVIGAAIIDTIAHQNTLLPFLMENFLAVFLGVTFSAIVGWYSLKGLFWVIEQGKFHYFAVYCFLVGLSILLFL